MVAGIYAGPCVEGQDRTVVEALVKDLIISKEDLSKVIFFSLFLFVIALMFR